MTTAVRYVGKWWIADKVENRVGGVLEISDEGTVILEIVDELVGDETVAIIHGHAAGKEVTLVNSFKTGGKIFMGQAYTTTEVVRSQLAFVGIHLDEELDNVFSHAEVEVSCLTSFIGDTGLQYTTTFDTNTGHFKRAQLDIEVPETLIDQAACSQQQVEIFWATESSSFENFTYGRNIRVTESAKLRVRASSPSSWNAFDQVIHRVQNLVTLASRQGSAVRSRKLAVIDDGRTHAVDLHFSTADTWMDAKVEHHKFLFHLSDISGDLGDGLAAWFSLSEESGIALDALFSLEYSSDTYLENELFNLASAAEGLHAKFFPNSTAHDPDVRSEIVKIAMEAFDGHAEKNWLKGILSNNRPGLKKRLVELASVPDDEAVLELLGSVDTWAKWLRDARNAVGHMNTGELERKIPENGRYRLAYVTKALLHLVLMQRLGISAEMQRRAVADIYGYSAHAFREAIAAASGN
ncbi:HEPN domain-containing protein [Nocardia tengchongensis]|uniref:ApeA N-terminal domain 1-containing protein n=1 Tax=Nocardia tengchongensis TaxID=2055889 RepID=UPI0036CF07B0